jgi:hypothetical protein
MGYRTANPLDSCMASIIVWDIETIPDLKGFAAANGLQGMSDDEVRTVLGDKFPKHIITRSSASEHWSPTGKAITGP